MSIPKKVQKNLDGEVVGPVSVTKEPVSYVKETYVTAKFKAALRSDKIDEAEELEELVRDKIRPIKGASIEKGDYDDAVKEILKKVGEEARA